MGMGGGAAADSMYNTQQQSGFGGGGSAYQTQGGAGGYNQTQTSQYSSMYPPRTEKARVRDIIERGKRWCKLDAENRLKAEAKERQKASKGNANQRRQDEQHKLEQEAIEAYKERQQKLQRIGSFKFDIDNELPEAILTSDQVFEDLDDIKNIREKTGGDENNQAYKSLIMAMYTKGKKKKKR